MKNILMIFAAFLIFPAAGLAQSNNISSVYTSLSDKVCKSIRNDPNEGGDYHGRCPGAGGYKLDLFEGDLRQTIDVIAPNKKTYPLDFGQNVTYGFSAVGEKAEWRVKGAGKTLKPFALIIRLNSSDDPVNSQKNTSYLLIAKITGNSACITDIVAPTVKDQNVRARELADASAAKPCVGPRQ